MIRSHLAYLFTSALMLGCGARTANNIDNGSNTNWLSGCTSDETCGSGICASGACTPTCTADDECAALDSDARCSRPVEVVVTENESCDEATSRRICAPGCKDESDCKGIGDGYTCVSRECVPAACQPSEVETQPGTSTQPTTNAPSYGTCEGKSCGDSCLLCSPDDAGCVESEEPKYCNFAGECVGAPVDCSSEDCENAPPGRCLANGCTPIVGSPIRFCEIRGPESVGCTAQSEQDTAETCAIHQETRECYLFPTTTVPAGWDAVDCDAAPCSRTACENECFSPAQRLDLAEIDSASGCECEEMGAACVDDIALVCEDGQWRSVFDGPCYPIETACQGYIPNVYACTSKFDNCSQTPWGYCGRGRTTAQCEEGILVPSEAHCSELAEQCYPLDDGLWCTGPASSLCPENFDVVEECNSPLPRSYSCRTPSTEYECQLQTVSAEQCRGLGGDVLADPGDGSTIEAGCPEGSSVLGFVPGSLEGELCCGEDNSTSNDTSDAG